jgi:transcriptional regulator with XRE-family HTH domain
VVAARQGWGGSFGSLLAELRRGAHLTQEQLADLSGLSARAISSLECGARQPRRFTLDRLASALRLSADARADLYATAERDRRRPAPDPKPGLVLAHETEALVGRAAELDDLRAHLAGSGPPVLAFHGEPGAGKTRLLAGAIGMAAAAGIPVLAAGARRGDDGYAPLADALAGHVRRTPAALLAGQIDGCAGLDGLLPELTGRVPALPVESRRLRYDAVGRFLDSVAGTGRVLVVLDDAQWMGTRAADLLAHLVRRDRRYLRVVVGCRTAEVPPDGHLGRCAADLARLNLLRGRGIGPLPAADAADLVDAVGALPADQRARILRRAGGLPLFLVELARAALAPSGDDLPWHLQVAVGHQLAALPDPAVRVLRQLALAGTTVAVERLVSAVQPVDDVLECLDTAARYGIVDETRDGFRFRYPLVREVLRAGLGLTYRRMWRPSALMPA